MSSNHRSFLKKTTIGGSGFLFSGLRMEGMMNRVYKKDEKGNLTICENK